MKEIFADYSDYSESEIKEYLTGNQVSNRQINQILKNGNISYILHTDYGIALLMSQKGETLAWVKTLMA